MVSNAVKRMADDLVPLEYVCARWAYSELLSNQPYHGSIRGPETKPQRRDPSANQRCRNVPVWEFIGGAGT
jgi:hypothetical protein